MIDFGTLYLQKPSYSLCKTHIFKNDLFATRSRKWHRNGYQNGSISIAFSLSFLTPFLNPLQISFLPKPTRQEEPKGPKRRKRNPKMEPKWDPNIVHVAPFLHPWSRLVPAWCPRGHPKHPRPDFHRFGLLFLPPQASFLSLFDSQFCSTRAQAPPRTAKNRQEPAKNLPKHKTHNDTPHQILLIEEPRQPPRNAEPEFGGRRCARRMASSIRSGPGGARGVFAVQMCSFPYVFCLKKASLVFSLKKGCLIVFVTCIFIKSKVPSL